VLEHVEDADQCIRELYRMMKPGGFGIFQIPQDINRYETYEDKTITSEKDRELHFWQKDHVRLFGLDYKDKLEAAGFKVTVEDYTKQISADLVERYRLPKGELLYMCRK
jgi:ubiquinone/menaquinone biosynthesis C-methylase UbiE